MTPTNHETLEQDAYHDTLSDGLIDLTIGLILALIGTIWLWIEWLPGLIGILSAAFAWALIRTRTRILEPRIGYVRWRAPRLRWERRQIIILSGLIMAAFLIGNGVMFAIQEGDALGAQGLAPGLPPFVLGVGAFAVAVKERFKRLWGYGVVLIGAGVVTILTDANPGGSLLVSGAFICGVGGILLTRFLRTHPVRDVG